MKGLILKDFINLKKNFKIFGVLIILYAFMAYTSEDSSFFSGVFTMLFAILVLSVYSYDEMVKWDSFALTMPLSKDNMVQNKYIMMLILTFAGTMISGICTILINVALHDSLFHGVGNCGFGAAIVIIFYSITLPFITKMGVEKARLIFFAVYMIPFFIIMLGSKMLKESDIIIPHQLLQLFNMAMQNIYIVLLIIVLFALSISYYTSIRIYRKKEF